MIPEQDYKARLIMAKPVAVSDCVCYNKFGFFLHFTGTSYPNVCNALQSNTQRIGDV